jgi:outer membrane protein X
MSVVIIDMIKAAPHLMVKYSFRVLNLTNLEKMKRSVSSFTSLGGTPIAVQVFASEKSRMGKVIPNAILIPILFVMAIGSVHGQAMLGGGIAYGADVEDMGLQARALYEISDRINVSADVIYYLDGVENFSYYEVNVNAQYEFYENAGFSAYGLAGFNYFGFTVLGLEGSDSGLNLGAGAYYEIGNSIAAFGELKHAIGGSEQFLLAAGLLFRLGN